MFHLLTNLICATLINVNPGTPATATKALSFDASAYVNAENKIRVAVQKSAAEPVVMLLRDKNNEVVFERVISKKAENYAVKLDVADLADGQYELEFKSKEGSIRKQVNLGTQSIQKTGRMIVMK